MNEIIRRDDILATIQKAQAKKRREIRVNKLKSDFSDPHYGWPGYGRGVQDYRRSINSKILRRIAEKAWMINTIIGHIIDKTVPYMRHKTSKSPRGWNIVMKDAEKKPTETDKEKIKAYTEFFKNCGIEKDSKRDKLITHTKKIIRDMYTLDQVNSELQYTYSGDLYAFYAVDAGTILKCTEEGYMGNDEIQYVQVVDSQIVTEYSDRELIFLVSTPRTDIYVNGYGYSKTEQAVDLVVSMINTFQFNTGAFSEDKLPRGMLLLNGDAGLEEIEEIEDYIVDVMSSPNSASGKWSIPIIPSSGKDQSLQWVQMGGSNRDMEFSRWYDELKAAICALFGVDMESTGLKTDKSAKIIDSGSQSAKEYSDDKAIGTTLGMLEDYYNTIMEKIDPNYVFQFEGFEQSDAKEARDTIESELKTFKSINDILVDHDMDTIDEDYANVKGINSPQVTQMVMAKQGQEAGGGMPPEDGEEEPTQDEEEPNVTDEEVDSFFKSLPKDSIVIRV